MSNLFVNIKTELVLAVPLIPINKTELRINAVGAWLKWGCLRILVIKY